MFLRQISIRGFRNFESQNVEFGPTINIFLGNNGQGKTNLLEAVNISLSGLPFRPTQPAELIKKIGPEGRFRAAVIKTIVELQNKQFSLRSDLSIEKRTYHMGEKKVSSTTVRRTFPQVVFSPESLSSIKSGPEERRHLIDEAAVLHDPTGATYLNEFQKALKTRNRVLADLKRDPLGNHSLKGVLASLRPLYLEKATQMTLTRVKMIRELNGQITEVFKELIGNPDVDISVDYVISGENATQWDAARIYDALNQRLVELEPQEEKVGHSLVGPHKHDLRILYNGNDSRFFCSQGQQRALVLAFKIAQIVYHRRVHKIRPLLLLDDVLSELDEQRRRYLVEFLRKNESQTLITTTDLELSRYFTSSDVKIFSVDNGRIEEISWPKKN